MLNWNTPLPNHPELTYDTLFVSMKQDGQTTKDIIDVFEVLTGIAPAKLRHTVRMKENNHKFLLAGHGLSHVSEAHCKAFRELLNRDIHPIAKVWLLENKRWARNLI